MVAKQTEQPVQQEKQMLLSNSGCGFEPSRTCEPSSNLSRQMLQVGASWPPLLLRSPLDRGPAAAWLPLLLRVLLPPYCACSR